MKGKAQAGLNRAWWDLSYDGAHKAHLMVPPPDATWLKNGPEGWRPLVVWGDFEQGGTQRSARCAWSLHDQVDDWRGIRDRAY